MKEIKFNDTLKRKKLTFFKGEKGITLVALIITIIILLILAVVTIRSVNEGSLFAHANNAATLYSKSASEENEIISSMISELEKHAQSITQGENPQGGEDNTIEQEVSELVGKYYICNGKGCQGQLEIKNNTDISLYRAFDTTYNHDTDNNTITATVNIDGEDTNLTFTYNIIKNSLDEIENILIYDTNFGNNNVYIKNPGVPANIDGIYVDTSDSNEQIKFQTETTDDGMAYIATYHSLNGGTTFGEEEGWYCLYNSSNSCYEIYYGQDGGVLNYTFDGNNTIRYVESGHTNKTYIKQ